MTATGAELPRSVRKGPPITVKCECGEKRDLSYGERWRCEGCGRNYDTNRIPVEEYAALRRDRVHDRILPTVVFVMLGCLVLVFALVGRPLAAILIVSLVGFMWGTFVRPKRGAGNTRRSLSAPAGRSGLTDYFQRKN